MKFSVPSSLIVCLMALIGHNPVNASPTYSQHCFETEAQAKNHQEGFKKREIDNSEKLEKDSKAAKLVWNQKTTLSDVKAVLGDPIVKFDKRLQSDIFTWELFLIGSPSAGEIYYNKSDGYCLNTRMGAFGIIKYEWQPENFDESRGLLTRSEFYG